MRYNNKRLVRSWLSETEVAEYWYAVKDEGFWRKMLAQVKKHSGVVYHPNTSCVVQYGRRLGETNYTPFLTILATIWL